MKVNKNTTIFFRLFYFAVVVWLIVILIWEFLDKPVEAPPNIQSNPKKNEFGFYSDHLVRNENSVGRNETLSEILMKHGVPGSNVAEIVKKSGNALDVKKIVAGNIYHTFLSNDSSNTLKYFVYEKSTVDYVVFDLNDSINVFDGAKEIIVNRKTKSAKIDNSLYLALMDEDASPELAAKLSQIYAWQIDFYHIQPGDSFKVIYEEQLVDSKFAAIGKILGAYFYHYGKEFYAIPFIQDSVFQYFDQDGNSLRKAFLKAPLDFSRISSRFSKSRFHPVLKKHRPHLGVDYAAPIGTPVRTTGDGVVVDMGFRGGNGRFVKVNHNSLYSTMYLHLSGFAKGIKNGAKVQQGQIIGYVGSSGLSTGPHLDYRFFVNNSPVDPLKVEVPPSHPVKKELRNEYDKKKNEVIKELNGDDQSLKKDKPV